MKKIISIILILCTLGVLIACGVKKNEEAVNKEDVNIETEIQEENVKEETEEKEEETEENKDEEKPEKEPQKEENKTESEPEKVPEKTETTLGNTLLDAFNEKASEGASAEKIALELLENPAIEFEGGIMPVEEGLLAGFDNAEIKGFKEGVMFSPMISSIPFVGYVFELENTSEADAFIDTLKKNANLRWNLCVEADEMITGSKGNKVFFVMCPKNAQAE